MLSFKFKIPGIIMVATGIVLTIIYFTHRIAIEFPVFAIQSSYLETRYFKVFKTNIFEELTIISFLSGFLMIAFSKEHREYPEYNVIRYRSWVNAVLCNIALTGFFTIFFFGAGFAAFLIVNVFMVYIIYLIVFNYRKFRFLRLKTLNDNVE